MAKSDELFVGWNMVLPTLVGCCVVCCACEVMHFFLLSLVIVAGGVIKEDLNEKNEENMGH